MAKQNLNTIKNWFRTSLKPTQAQFWDVWDSFWHKDEKIPISSIENLDTRFNEKADTELVNVLTKSSAPIVALATAQVDGIFTLNWDASKINQFGNYGRFAVEQANTYQQVPISIIKNEQGLPLAYKFQLDNIDTLIHII